MYHYIKGNNFHGNYSVRVRGAAQGFVLSPAQAKKVSAALCGCEGCVCGGGYGADSDSAITEPHDFDLLILIPAKQRQAHADARFAAESAYWDQAHSSAPSA
jgi:hypothetical protein